MPNKKVSATIHVTAVIDGQDGTSPWIADLSNEMDSVACDLNGKPTAAKSLTTTIALFYGQTAKSFGTPTVKRNGTAVTVNASSYANGVKVSYSNKVLTVAYSTSAVISGTDEYEITITASDDPAVVRTLTFSVLGARPGATGEAATTYQLVPSVSEIVRRKDGSYSPASLTCYCTSLKDGTATDNPSAATMQYSYDGSSWTAFSSSTSFAASDIYAQPSKKLYLRLLVDGKVMDKETVPVVEEGQDGVTYRIAVNPESITIPSDSPSVTVNKISGNFFYRKGDGEEQQLITNFVLWRKAIDGTYTRISYHANVEGFEYNGSLEITGTVAALVVCLQHTLTNDPNVYYARLEIPVRKNGDTGQPGPQGARGSTGRMYYMAGQWVTGKTYACTDKLCPVVYYGSKFWFMENEGSSTGDVPSDSSTVWDELAGFDMVITNAVFVEEFAKLGSFVVAQDFFFTQYGTIVDSNGQEHLVNTKDPYPQYNELPAYMHFDATDPMAETRPASGQYKFRPMKVVNAFTGEEWMASGKIHVADNGALTVQDAVIKGTLMYKRVFALDAARFATTQDIYCFDEINFQLAYDVIMLYNTYNSRRSFNIFLPPASRCVGATVEIYNITTDWTTGQVTPSQALLKVHDDIDGGPTFIIVYSDYSKYFTNRFCVPFPYAEKSVGNYEEIPATCKKLTLVATACPQRFAAQGDTTTYVWMLLEAADK